MFSLATHIQTQAATTRAHTWRAVTALKCTLPSPRGMGVRRQRWELGGSTTGVVQLLSGEAPCHGTYARVCGGVGEWGCQRGRGAKECSVAHSAAQQAGAGRQAGREEKNEQGRKE